MSTALCKPASNIIGSICRGDQCGISFGNGEQEIVDGGSRNTNICTKKRNVCGMNGRCIPADNSAGRH